MSTTNVVVKLVDHKEKTTSVFQEGDNYVKFFNDISSAEWHRELYGTYLSRTLKNTEHYFQEIVDFGKTKSADEIKKYQESDNKTKGFDFSNVPWVSTKTVTGKSLGNWLKSKNNEVDVSVIRKFAFQLIFVVAKCHIEYGLQHNDLHEGNIIVDEVKAKETLTFKIRNKDHFKIDLEPGDLKFVLIDFGACYINVDNKDWDLKKSKPWRFPSGTCLQHNRPIEHILVKDIDDAKNKILIKPESEMFTIGHILMSMSAHIRWKDYKYETNVGPHFVRFDDTNTSLKQWATKKSRENPNLELETSFRYRGYPSIIDTLDFYARMKILTTKIFKNETPDIAVLRRRANHVSYFLDNIEITDETSTFFDGLQEALKKAETYQIIRKLMDFDAIKRANFGILNSTDNTYCLLFPLYHYYFQDFVSKESGANPIEISKFLKPASYNNNFDKTELENQESIIAQVISNNVAAQKAKEEAAKKAIEDATAAQEAKEKVKLAVKEAKDIADKALKEAKDAKNLANQAKEKAKTIFNDPSTNYDNIIQQAEKAEKDADDLETTTIKSATNSANDAEKKLEDVKKLVANFPDISIDDNTKNAVTNAKQIAKEAANELTEAKRFANEKKGKATEAAEQEKKKSGGKEKEEDEKIVDECKKLLLMQMNPSYIANEIPFVVENDLSSILSNATKCLKYIAANVEKITDTETRDIIKSTILKTKNVAKAKEKGDDGKEYFLYQTAIKKGKGQKPYFDWYNTANNAGILSVGLYLAYKKNVKIDNLKQVLQDIGGNPDAKGANLVVLVKNILEKDLPKEVVEFLTYKEKEEEKNKQAVVRTDKQDNTDNYKDKLREFIVLLEDALFQPSSLQTNPKNPVFVGRADVFNKKMSEIGFTEDSVNEKMKAIDELYKQLIDAKDEAENIKMLLAQETIEFYFDKKMNPIYQYDQFKFNDKEHSTKDRVILLLKWIQVVHLRVIKKFTKKEDWTSFAQGLNINTINSAKIIYDGIQKMLQEVIVIKK